VCEGSGCKVDNFKAQTLSEGAPRRVGRRISHEAIKANRNCEGERKLNYERSGSEGQSLIKTLKPKFYRDLNIVGTKPSLRLKG